MRKESFIKEMKRIVETDNVAEFRNHFAECKSVLTEADRLKLWLLAAHSCCMNMAKFMLVTRFIAGINVKDDKGTALHRVAVSNVDYHERLAFANWLVLSGINTHIKNNKRMMASQIVKSDQGSNISSVMTGNYLTTPRQFLGGKPECVQISLNNRCTSEWLNQNIFPNFYRGQIQQMNILDDSPSLIIDNDKLEIASGGLLQVSYSQMATLSFGGRCLSKTKIEGTKVINWGEPVYADYVIEDGLWPLYLDIFLIGLGFRLRLIEKGGNSAINLSKLRVNETMKQKNQE